jgi:hypothetical protein
MSISYEIFKDTRLIIVTSSGPADVNEIIDMLARARSDPDFDITFDVLWDASERTAPFTSEDMRTIADYVRKHLLQGDKPSKRAFVVSKDVDFGMVRLYENYRTFKSTVDIEVFKNRGEALKWLGHKG